MAHTNNNLLSLVVSGLFSGFVGPIGLLRRNPDYRFNPISLEFIVSCLSGIKVKSSQQSKMETLRERLTFLMEKRNKRKKGCRRLEVQSKGNNVHCLVTVRFHTNFPKDPQSSAEIFLEKAKSYFYKNRKIE